ncbi:hypothetical protein WBG99_23335 [Streptomyces sp. TG1A-60]|uniref:hypothetical protein n=1 Tax=Streptomyces sp. TG1A-60 TaxID=3129111 RepID=UPI0030CBD81E
MALGLVVLTAAGLLTLAGPAGSAEAAASSCAGRKVRTLAFTGGAVHVHRSGRRVCAVTVRGKGGKKGRTWMMVSLRARGGAAVRHQGSARRQTLPVTVHAGRRPVLIKAAIGSMHYTSRWIRV